MSARRVRRLGAEAWKTMLELATALGEAPVMRARVASRVTRSSSKSPWDLAREAEAEPSGLVLGASTQSIRFCRIRALSSASARMNFSIPRIGQPSRNSGILALSSKALETRYRSDLL